MGEKAVLSGVVTKRRLFFFVSSALVALAVVSLLWASLSKPATVFDEAFELFGLEDLAECPGFDEQKEIFLLQRGPLVRASQQDTKTLSTHWDEFLSGPRGEKPEGCEWTITPYPIGFIATGKSTVIVLNPSDSVLGAPLPEGTTGDFVMDVNRYSDTSLGAFRGAATIPPRSLAVIALR